jgi:hypothetical protein
MKKGNKMKKLIFLVLVVLALGLLPVAGQAATYMYDNQATWAAAVGGNFAYVDLSSFATGYTLVPANTAISLPAPGSGSVSFGIDLYSAIVPDDWFTWSGGNTPQILWTDYSATSVTGTFTAGQKAFGLEMEPDDQVVHNMTLTVGAGGPSLTLTQPVNGDGGALFFGWVAPNAQTTFTLSSDADFAFGRMVQPVPVPPSVLLLGSGLLGLIGWRRMRKS